MPTTLPSGSTRPANALIQNRTWKPAVIIANLVLLCLGCRKNAQNYDSSKGCITRNIPLISDQLVTKGVVDTALMLFKANNIDQTNQQPTEIYYYPPDSSGEVMIEIYTRRFVNGLLARFGGNNYYFYKGKLKNIEQHLAGTPQNRDTTAKLSLEEVRKIFLDSKPDNYLIENTFTKKPITHWADSCVLAVLMYDYNGYYNESGVPTSSLVKIWNIYTPSRGMDNAVTLILDDTGRAFPQHSGYFF